jgi:cyclopropane fatty-acyl-phospholipid synthase-like methyltransferase
VKYVGFDASQEYIKAAQTRYGVRATFICEQVSTTTLKEPSSFDIVLAIGILHHLDDAEALQLFHLAQAALKPGGRLITFDGVFVEKQSPFARYIISRDRGQNVRTKEGYLAIASQVFSNIAVTIRHDLLRIPYTHLILECTR